MPRSSRSLPSNKSVEPWSILSPKSGIPEESRKASKAVARLDANPKVTDVEIAAILTASTGKPVSFKTVAWNRLRLGLRKNREPLQPGQKRRTPLSVTCKKISEAMKERHARNPLSEDARRRIADGQKRRWAEAKARQAA